MKGVRKASLVALVLMLSCGLYYLFEYRNFYSSLTETAQTPIYPPGLRIGIVPPKNMVQAQNFAGFEDAANRAIIVMAELAPELYSKIESDLQNAKGTAEGFELIDCQAWPVKDGKGLFIKGKHNYNEQTFYKWMLLRGTDTVTTMVTFQIPEESQIIYDENTIIKTLRSLKIRDPLEIQADLNTLPFKFDTQENDKNIFPPFRISSIIPGKSVIMTLGAKDFVQDAEQPLIIITSSNAAITGGLEQDRFARQSLANLINGWKAKIKRGGSIARGNVQWHEIEADAHGPLTGSQMNIIQAIRFDRKQFIQITAASRQEEWEDTKLYFNHLINTIKPRLQTGTATK